MELKRSGLRPNEETRGTAMSRESARAKVRAYTVLGENGARAIRGAYDEHGQRLRGKPFRGVRTIVVASRKP